MLLVVLLLFGVAPPHDLTAGGDLLAIRDGDDI